MKRLPYITSVVVLMLTNAALAGDKITGTFFFGRENCEGESTGKSCNLSFQIDGDAAKTLYRNMKAKAVKDECTEDMSKTDNSGLKCYKTGASAYSCDFGYNFKKRAFGDSDVDC